MSLELVRYPSDLDYVERGKLLQFQRGQFDHWAVYMGGRQICHFTVNSEFSDLVSNGLRSGKGEIRVQPFEEVAGNSVVYVNCSYDKKWTPYSPSEIVRRAGSRCGENLYYDLADYNCEHFVNWCRYGVNYSKQVESVKAEATFHTIAGLGMSVVFGPVVGVAYGCSVAYQAFKGSKKGGDSCIIH